MVKLGLGDTYDKTILPEKFRAYGDMTKPASSIGVMATVPFAAIIYAELPGTPPTSGVEFLIDNWRTVIYASVTFFLLHGGSQAMNMAEDAFMDKQTPHKQNRPIPAGIVTSEEARTLAWIFMFVGVARAFTMNYEFGILATILAFFGIFYNIEPIRAKKRLWINLIWQATSRGLLLFPATFAVWGGALNPVAWIMGLLAFMLVLAMQNTADFADAEVDERFDIITPAVHHGLDDLVKIMAGISVFMFASMTLFIVAGLIPPFWSLYILAIPIGWSLYSLWKEPRNVSDLGGNHLSWYVFYFSLAGLYIFPALQLVVT